MSLQVDGTTALGTTCVFSCCTRSSVKSLGTKCLKFVQMFYPLFLKFIITGSFQLCYIRIIFGVVTLVQASNVSNH